MKFSHVQNEKIWAFLQSTKINIWTVYPFMVTPHARWLLRLAARLHMLVSALMNGH
jgi:hypothetical protein